MAGSGLEGVVVAKSGLGKIDGQAGTLQYAGYPINELADHTTFEEVCYLLWHGELPNAAQRDALQQELAASYKLPAEVLEVVRAAPPNTHPMAVLRTAVSALGIYDSEAEDMSREANLRKALRLTARLPTITAATARVRDRQEPVDPRPDLGIAANLLYMMTGEEPGPQEVRTMDVALILHAEHGLNASTFAGRVTIATLSDLFSAVTSAIGTLKGPLHGGANERVMGMLREIGEPEHAEAWIRRSLERGDKIMGFGHRVYRALDPRAPILRDLGEELGSSKWFEISDRVRQAVRAAMDEKGKQIYANVDFFSASVYDKLGIPTAFFTNIFACARIAGWTAHILEQLDDNRLIRPKAEYAGPEGRSVQPIAQRD